MAVRDVLNEKLKCPICLDHLQDARVLTCGHTFCFTCIEQDYNRSRLTLGICPYCKKSYYVQRNDVRNLSKNFIVNEVLETLQSAGTGQLCSLCQEGEGSYICLKCKLNLCDHCTRRDTNNCEHLVISVADMNSKQFLREIIKSSKCRQTCPSHSDESASYFCQTCKRVLCNACRVQDHLHHETKGLQETVKNLRAEGILGLFEEKMRKFDQRKKSLMRQAPTYATAPVELQEEILRYESYRDECSDLHRDMCHLFQFGSDKTIMELYHRREKRINEILGIPTRTVLRVVLERDDMDNYTELFRSFDLRNNS